MIQQADALTYLSTLTAETIDALVTDPPAGISFMGKDWDTGKGFIEDMAKIFGECLRILKPGAHGLVWALPRTSHWTATALEQAGFEIRDVVTHLFGTGFPKSLDVSKAIDKAAGAERATTGRVKPGHQGFQGTGKAGTFNHAEGWDRPWMHDAEKANAYHMETSPTTPEAKQWEGWGTALKPASEHWILVRKPLGEKTVAKNVLKHGTGGINVDASRISVSLDDPNHRKSTGGYVRTESEALIPNGPYNKTRDATLTQGRFPANLILSHNEDCEDACTEGCAIAMLDGQSGFSSGGKRGPTVLKRRGHGVGGNIIEGSSNAPLDYSDSGGASRFFYCAKASRADRNQGLDGKELIWESELWEKPDLNSLMENIHQLAKGISEDILTVNSVWNIGGFGNNITEKFRTDLMFTISIVSKLITELKTSNSCQSSSIKESTVGAIRTITANGLSLAETVEFISQSAQNTTSEKMASLLGVVTALCSMLLKIKSYAKTGNFHATVKSTKLMEYLIRLVTPPNGTVLDPFMGSGSTGVAAKRLGFGFVGIEREAEYFEIAKRRIEACPL